MYRPFNPHFFAGLPPRAYYVLDRVALLPLNTGKTIRLLFYSEKATPECVVKRRLSSLYLSQKLQPSRFVNLDNFPIDVLCYCPLREMFQDDMSMGEEVAGRI